MIILKDTYTIEEQKINRKLWTQALRSGDYQQTTAVLCDGSGGFCCLGVLAELVSISNPEVREETADHVYYDGAEEVLSKKLREVVGLRTDSGNFKTPIKIQSEEVDEEPFEFSSLVDLNDEAGLDFNKIADIIDNEPFYLFNS